jgi:hypothetical protein
MITILDCEQRSPEWLEAHMGIATASIFKELMMEGKKKGEPSLTRAQRVRRKAAEIIRQKPDPRDYTNANMQRGIDMEEEARTEYRFLNPDYQLTRVGFIRNLKAGCSPDALVNANGMLEIKTTFPDLLLEVKDKKEFPAEHRPQVQGQLWVAEREWCDLVIYYSDMEAFIVRAHRDEAYIRELEEAVDRFNEEVADWVRRHS